MIKKENESSSVAEDPSPRIQELEKQSIFKKFINWIKCLLSRQKRSASKIIEHMETFDGRPLKSEEKVMIHDLVEFYDLTVDEIKIPRNAILAVEQNNINNIFEIMKERRSSRIPVYDDNLDKIIGFFNVKDLFMLYKESGNLDSAIEVMNKILFVPPTMKAFDLLVKMKKDKIHIAVIIDEYGGTDGIVTINSIISEIVGKIDDSALSEQDSYVLTLGDNEYQIDGKMHLDELNDEYGINLITEEFDDIETLNGLILYICNGIPNKEEIVKLPGGYAARILESNDRMVNLAIIYIEK